MPGWSDITNKIRAVGSGHDVVRRDQIAKLAEKTGRNVIVYYSGYLQKGPLVPQAMDLMIITDADKNGFMATCQNLDFTKGLDLLLHTPGGDAHATESIIDYLQSLFGNDIRAIVPQIAMSGGTVISCACKSIVMGKHSNLGPIDPQVGGVAAYGILEEFDRAVAEINANPVMAHVWAPILAKYPPTLIGACQKNIQLIEGLAQKYLAGNMFQNEADPAAKAKQIVDEIGSHAKQLSHGRHISLQQAQDIGLKIEPLENDPDLQDLVLSVHHACMVTLQETAAIKIIENQHGKSFIMAVQIQVAPQQMPAQPVQQPAQPAQQPAQPAQQPAQPAQQPAQVAVPLAKPTKRAAAKPSRAKKPATKRK